MGGEGRLAGGEASDDPRLRLARATAAFPVDDLRLDVDLTAVAPSVEEVDIVVSGEPPRLRLACPPSEVALRLAADFLTTAGELIGGVTEAPTFVAAAAALRLAGTLASVPPSAGEVDFICCALRRLLIVSLGARRRRFGFGLLMACAEPEVCVLWERDLLLLLRVVVVLVVLLLLVFVAMMAVSI